MSELHIRWSVFSLCVVFFWSNVLAAHAGEVGFWKERRYNARRMHGTGSTSETVPTGFGLRVEQHRTLTQLPKAGKVNLGGVQGKSSVKVGPAVSAVALRDFRPLEHPTRSGDTPTWVSQLILPYGSILDVHLAQKPNAPLVIHIQDAHGIEEAQKNMAAMIQGLSENRGVTLVGVEAAQGPFNMEPYRNWPDAGLTRDVAAYFLKEGTIGGAEFAGVTAPHPMTLWGIENTDLYLANVQALKDANKLKPELKKVLVDIKTSVSFLKETIYSKELKDFDSHFQAYQDQREGLGVYVKFLTRGITSNPKALPNLQLLVKAIDIEERLDFKGVEQERLWLVERLARQLTKLKLDALVQRSFQYRAGQMGYGDYHRFLKSLCRENKIPLYDLKQLDDYIEYVLLADKIDRNKLLEELTRAEKETQDRLAKTPEQKKLVDISRRLALLEKLSTHTMTPDDWATYENERGDILTITSDLTAISGKEQAPNPDTLIRLLSASENFCRYALERNAAFIDNLSVQIETNKASTAVLVAGGFHSDGLTRLLRDRDLSYVVVTPKITEVPKENNYLDVFAHDPLPLEKLFAGEKIFLRYPATLGAHSIPGFEQETLLETLRFLVRQHFNQGRDARVLRGALSQTKYPITLVKDSVKIVDFLVAGKPLRLNVSGNGIVDAVPSPLYRRFRAWWGSHTLGNKYRTMGDKQKDLFSPEKPRLMSMGYGKYLALMNTQTTSMKDGGSLTGWERFLLWLHNPLKGGPVAETVLLGVLGIVGKAVLGMSLMDPLGLTWATFGVFLIIGALFSLGHPDLYAPLSYQESDYMDGKLKKSAFIRELGMRVFVVFGQRFVAGSVMAGFLLMLPPTGGVAAAWAFHEIWNIGVARRWPVFRSLRYLFMGARSLETGPEEGREAEGPPSGAEKTDSYIYDPVMRRSIISRLSTQNGFVDPDHEFSTIYREVEEIFQNVLKAAHDRLIREGKAKQAEGLLNADLFLADNEEVNAYALIYFNFVGINTGLLKELHKNSVLTKDLIAFILAHEVTHLIQYREDVDAGKVREGLSFNNLDDLMKKKFHEKVEWYAKEQDADVRAVDLVNEAGYSMGEITAFFDLMAQNPGVRNRFFTMMDDHPQDKERSAYLRKIVAGG